MKNKLMLIFLLILLLLIAFNFLACSVAPTCDIPCTNDIDSYSETWESLPIHIQTNNDLDLAVIEIYNTTFDTEVFVADDFGYPIEYVDDLDDGIDGSTYTYKDNDYIISARVSIRSDILYDSDLYEKVLAHELGHVLGAGHFCDSIMTGCADTLAMSIEDALLSENFSSWFYKNYYKDLI